MFQTGLVSCTEEICPVVTCEHAVKIPGECCLTCSGTKTSSYAPYFLPYLSSNASTDHVSIISGKTQVHSHNFSVVKKT